MDKYIVRKKLNASDDVFVAFPMFINPDYESEIATWVKENTRYEWGYVKGNIVGAYMSKEDATAFYLRFNA